MKIITSDFETTTWNTGNPFDVRNYPVCLGWKEDETTQTKTTTSTSCFFDLPRDIPWDSTGLFVFFNAKFDLHYYRKLGFDVSSLSIWCCQIGEFLLSGQTLSYPSLNEAAAKYQLGQKVDVVKEEYWNKGINTDKIPRNILEEYTKQDVDLTYQVYLKQKEQFEKNPQLYQAFKLACQDCLVLEEMEWNALKYDKTLCLQRSAELTLEIAEIERTLISVYPDVPINFNSGAQLSAFLYGGVIIEETKEEAGHYKTGKQAGQVKLRKKFIEHQLPRLIEPLPKTELAVEGQWKTNQPTLLKLKGTAAKKFVGPLIQLAKLQKLDGTYYKGLVQLCEEHHWPENRVHGDFNQCVARTGRLTATKPNKQNQVEAISDIFISRFT